MTPLLLLVLLAPALGVTLVHEVSLGQTIQIRCPSNDDNHRFQFWRLQRENLVIGPTNKFNREKFKYTVIDGTLTIRIVDVAIPYEDAWDAVHAARERKLTKDAPLVQALTAGGFTTTCNAYIVGSLGVWDAANWTIMAGLGINRRHRTLLARRCCSEAIRCSHDIYVTHLSGIQQWPH